MSLETPIAHLMLGAVPELTHCSLHSVANPAGGANELTGGDYARQESAWGSIANRKRLIAETVVFPLAPGHQPKSVGFWAGTTFIGAQVLPVQPAILVDDATYTCPAAETGLVIP